ncbi:MAG: hypothetical protein R3E89_00785 [Thiolinea sp.]
MLAAHIACHGFKLEGEYRRRKIARAPKAPYKTVAALFIAVTTAVLANLGASYSIPASIILGRSSLWRLCAVLWPGPTQGQIRQYHQPLRRFG